MKTRDKNFTVRLTQEEYNYLKTEAAKLFMTIGGYIRLKAIVQPLEDEREVRQ